MNKINDSEQRNDWPWDLPRVLFSFLWCLRCRMCDEEEMELAIIGPWICEFICSAANRRTTLEVKPHQRLLSPLRIPDFKVSANFIETLQMGLVLLREPGYRIALWFTSNDLLLERKKSFFANKDTNEIEDQHTWCCQGMLCGGKAVQHPPRLGITLAMEPISTMQYTTSIYKMADCRLLGDNQRPLFIWWNGDNQSSPDC